MTPLMVVSLQAEAETMRMWFIGAMIPLSVKAPAALTSIQIMSHL